MNITIASTSNQGGRASKLYRPIGSVYLSGVRRMVLDKIKSPSGPVNENSATTARIGFDSGIMISKKIRKLLAPSILADSSRSFGIASR